MRKRILSLLIVLALCLSLLPVTALAVDAPATLYVGNQQVISGTETTYWSTNNSGELTQSAENNAWNVKYDPNTVTLTLKNATIKGVYNNVNTSGSGIYAASSSGPVSLNIVLEEENKVSGMYGIDVSSSGGDASLNISGSGSLTVSGLSGNGIGIFMSSQNSANLTIKEASVTALGSQDGGSGVRLITSQTGSPSLTIEVKGGSLQASGETNGIHFLSNVNDATAVANMKISGNAGNHNVIVDGGTLDENLANSLGDSVKYAPAITNHLKNVEVKEKETATFTVEATGSDLSYQWQQSTDNGSKWTNITVETNTTYTIATTTMDMNGTQYRCVVENNIGKVTSDAATLTVQKATTPIEPKYVRYIVEHYKQNADGSYTLADTEQPIDEIGKTVTATPKTYAGYTYNPNAAGTVASGTLIAISNPDDIVTLKLYYDRTAYPVTVETDGNGTALASPASAPEETLITLTAVPNSGYHFDRWEVVSGDITITNNTFTMPAEPVTVKAVFDRDSSGGAHYPDAGSTTTTSSDRYEIETPSDVENGSVKASASKAEKGDTVTVTVTPDDGYALDKLVVYDEDGDKLDLNDKGDGKFTFQMPKGDVSIEVSFAPIEDETPKADFSDVPADA